MNSIIGMHANHSMRCIKTQLHSEKIAPCEWPFRPMGDMVYKYSIEVEHSDTVAIFLGLRGTLFSMYCATRGFTGMARVYMCTCGVVEYRASENVAPAILGSDIDLSVI